MSLENFQGNNRDEDIIVAIPNSSKAVGRDRVSICKLAALQITTTFWALASTCQHAHRRSEA
jgi:hypothetical protein